LSKPQHFTSRFFTGKARLVEGGDRRLPGRGRRSLMMARVIAASDASRGLALLDAGPPLLQFLGGLARVAAEFGDQRHQGAVDAGHQPIGVLPLVAPYRSGFEICPPGLLVVRAVLASYPVALSS